MNSFASAFVFFAPSPSLEMFRTLDNEFSGANLPPPPRTRECADHYPFAEPPAAADRAADPAGNPDADRDADHLRDRPAGAFANRIGRLARGQRTHQPGH